MISLLEDPVFEMINMGGKYKTLMYSHTSQLLSFGSPLPIIVLVMLDSKIVTLNNMFKKNNINFCFLDVTLVTPQIEMPYV